MIFKLTDRAELSLSFFELISNLFFIFDVIPSNYHIFIRLIVEIMAMLNRMTDTLAGLAFHIEEPQIVLKDDSIFKMIEFL